MKPTTRLATLIGCVAAIIGATFYGERSAADASPVRAGSPARAPTFHRECIRRTERRGALFFRTADGVRLAGVVLGKGQRGVVLAHQVNGDLCTWLPFARILARVGYRVLAFDFRGYGASRKAVREDYAADVTAAAATLRRQHVKTVILVGASMGGTAVLVSAARLVPPADAVISLSGPPELGDLDARAAVQESDVPVLFLASRDDSFAADQKLLYDAARATDKHVEIVPGADHGIEMLFGANKSLVRALVFAFLKQHSH